MKERLNWAVLGTGVIANQMAQALQKMGKPLYAVGNRTYEKAVAFAKKYGVQKVYSEIDEMFTDENVDIIYITSPHNTHYAFMKKALLHDKHLFVEKSITLNSRELDEMIALARRKKSHPCRSHDHLAYADLQKALGNCPQRFSWKSPDDHHEFRKFQRIQHEQPFLQYEPGRRCHAGYRCLRTLHCPELYG